MYREFRPLSRIIALENQSRHPCIPSSYRSVLADGRPSAAVVCSPSTLVGSIPENLPANSPVRQRQRTGATLGPPQFKLLAANGEQDEGLTLQSCPPFTVHCSLFTQVLSAL